MRRVLLVSNDPIGRRMAGPGVRYYHFARELARRFEVTLVAPARPDVELEGVDVLEARTLPPRRFLRLARTFDSLVAQQLSPLAMSALARAETRVVYDLYDPLLVENLPLFAEHPPGRARESAYRSVARSQLLALAAGDAFACASERQRDLWLGALGTLGRIDVNSYGADPALRGLVDVVPFGVPSSPPQPGPPALKGVVPGIGEDDRVLLWSGGVWSWFDPLTVIRAVGRISRARDDVKLYFLGTRHPKPEVGAMPMAARAARLAEELGLAGTHVFFNEEWVEYGDRGRYLVESDLGVSAHLDSVESRFAFRTRLLDHFWAGLPTVATGGDVLGDLVAERGLGRVVAVGDADAFAAAVTALLDDESAYAEAQRALAAVREELAWPRVAERLAALLTSEISVPPAGGITRRMLGSSLHSLRAAIRQEGARTTAARVLEAVRRPRVP